MLDASADSELLSTAPTLRHNPRGLQPRSPRWRRWKLTFLSAQPGAMCADERWSHLEGQQSARLGIDDAPLDPLRSPFDDEVLPIEHDLGLVPSLIAHADLAVFCGIK